MDTMNLAPHGVLVASPAQEPSEPSEGCPLGLLEQKHPDKWEDGFPFGQVAILGFLVKKTPGRHVLCVHSYSK